MINMTRRTALGTAALAAMAIPGRALAAEKLSLTPIGEARTLPARAATGGSVEAEYEVMIGDDRKLAALAPLRLGVTRFPGGTPSSYYDWRTGHFNITAKPDSSGYTKAMSVVYGQINETFKSGIHYEEYRAFSQKLGAEPILVANTTTSTPAEQAAWMDSLVKANAAPTLVEMGNEPWIAEAGEPDLLKRWSSGAAEQAITKEFVAAMRARLPEGVKFAIQAAPGDFGRWRMPLGKFWKERLDNWNSQLANEPWFDAVVPHHYSAPNSMLPNVDASLVDDPVKLNAAFDAMLSAWDAGVDDAIGALERQFPGKDIWITEWNPRGGELPDASGKVPVHFEPTPSLMLHATARGLFAYLRHASVTAHNLFMFNALSSPWAIMIDNGAGGYGFLPMGTAVGWFAQATRDAPRYQRLIERAASPIQSPYLPQQSYRAVEAAHLNGKTGETLIVQNASAQSRVLSLAGFGGGKRARAETISLPDLHDQVKKAAAPMTLEARKSIKLPPYSLTRIVWTA